MQDNVINTLKTAPEPQEMGPSLASLVLSILNISANIHA